MRIDIIPINQNGNIFYVGKIKARDLVNIATTKIRKPKTSTDFKNYLLEIDELSQREIESGNVWYLKGFTKDDDIQRMQNCSRLKEIGQYIEKANTIFPNSIICNFYPDDNYNIKVDENYIDFDPQRVNVTIIDGQHRLGGFNYVKNKEYYLDNFDLIVTILIGLLPSQQAELFSVINGKQKPVNKSILYDLSAMSEEEYSEQIFGHLITTWFNVNEKSPLQNCIKILGSGDGSVSQALMIDAMCRLFSTQKVRSSETLELPIFRNEYEKQDSVTIIQNLLDYFVVVSKVFNDMWNVDNKSILIKSTGIAGLLKAYPTFYCYLKFFDNRTDRYFELKKLIDKARKNGFSPSAITYGGGGSSQQRNFAQDLVNKSFDVDDFGCNIRNLWVDNMQLNN